MGIFLATGIPPTNKLSKLRVRTKDDYRRLLEAELAAKETDPSTLPTKVAEVETAALTAGWDVDWDVLYPVAVAAPVPKAGEPMFALDTQIAMLKRLKELRDLEASLGVASSSGGAVPATLGGGVPATPATVGAGSGGGAPTNLTPLVLDPGVLADLARQAEVEATRAFFTAGS